VWQTVSGFFNRTQQLTMFQPVGGIDMIGKAFAKKLAGKIRLNSKVSKIAQDDKGVTVTYEDVATGKTGSVTADFCVCTIPLPILSQIEIQVSAAKQAAIKGLPYHSSCKVGLEMKRRFWEQDEQIYGGHSYTTQSISEIAYPSYGFFKPGPAVVLGAYAGGAAAYQFAGMTPEERIETALKQGSVFHKQYRPEFSNGVAVAWSRLPWIQACASSWAEDIRKQHYQNLVSVDGRVPISAPGWKPLCSRRSTPSPAFTSGRSPLDGAGAAAGPGHRRGRRCHGPGRGRRSTPGAIDRRHRRHGLHDRNRGHRRADLSRNLPGLPHGRCRRWHGRRQDPGARIQSAPG
jgi:monoamine oxidase